jgi:hypothetical protein
MVLTNPSKDQVATKVSMQGDLDGPNTNVLVALVYLLRNAFIQALQPAIDQEVNIADVGSVEPERKGFFKQLFSRDEEKDRP